MLGYILKIKLRNILYCLICFSLVILLIFQFGLYEKSLSIKEDTHLSILLWWTPFINSNESRIISCETSKCMITEDRNYLNKSHTSAILFYGSSFDPYDLPLPKVDTQNWAMIHEESPKNVALFLHKNTWNLFNYTSTFSRYSNFPITLQHVPNIQILFDKMYFRSVSEKNKLLTNLSPVLYIQSDCVTPLERDSYVLELMKYISIDSYGICLNNKVLPEKLKQNPLNNLYSDDFLHFVAQYKFVIAFENAICDDYITEKLWRPLISGSIPIYMGSSTIKDWLPNNNSAIFADEFNNPKDLAEFINKLNTDDHLYNSYLEHKISGQITNKLLLDTLQRRKWVIDKKNSDDIHYMEAFECYICDEIHKESKYRQTNENTSVYNCADLVSPITKQTNITNWWNEFWREGKCQAHLLKKYVDDKSINKITKDMFESETNRLINQNLC